MSGLSRPNEKFTNSAESWLADVNSDLQKAQWQAETRNNGGVTTCQYFDVEKLTEQKMMLELMLKHRLLKHR